MDFSKVSLKEQETDTVPYYVCRLCFELTFVPNIIPLKDFNNKHLIQTTLQEIDLELTDDPVACTTCFTIVKNTFNFKSRCLQNEKLLKSYVEGLEAAHRQNKVNLQHVVYVNLNNLSKYCNDSEVPKEVNHVTIKDEPVSQETNTDESVQTVEINNEIFWMPNPDVKNELTIEEVILNWFPQDDSMAVTREGPKNSTSKKSLPKREKTFKCPHCSFKSVNRLSVSKHIVRSHRKTPFQCNFCQKVCKQKINMDSHFLSKHTNIRNIESYITNKIHRCSFCKFRTMNSFNLDSHIATKHQNRSAAVRRFRIYSCKHCSYSTTNKGNFTTHETIHSKVKKFRCQLCRGSYRQKRNLNQHILMHHRKELEEFDDMITNKVHKCSHCDFMSLSKSKFSRHVVSNNHE